MKEYRERKSSTKNSNEIILTRMDNSLHDQTDLLRAVINGLPDIVALQKPDHTIMFYNEAGYRFLNKTPAEVDGRKCYELIGRSMPCELCATSKARVSKKMETVEKYMPEYEIWVEARAIPILDGHNNVQMIVEILRDITERQITEEALREAEWKFRALFENSPIGVAYHRMIYDEAGAPVDYLFLDANENFRKLTGVDPRGKRVTEAFPGIENDPTGWIGKYWNVVRTGESLHSEQYLEFNDQWYEIVAFRYAPDEFVAAFINISDRKVAEKRIQESERRLALASSLAHVGHWDRNPQTGDLIWTDEVYRIFGYKPGEIVPSLELFISHVSPEDRRKVQMAIKASESNPIPYNVEFRFRRKGGTECIGRATGGAEFDQNGRAMGMSGAIQDITDIRQAEDSLKELRRYNDMILDSAGEGIMGLDADGNYAFVNPAAAQMLGYAIEDLLGKNSHSTSHHTKPDGSPYLKEDCPICVSLENGSRHGTSKEIFWRRDGTSFPVIYSTNLIIENGTILGTVVTFQDISDREKAEELLRESEEKYRSLAEISEDYIMRYDRQHRHTYMNPASLRAAGLSAGDIIGKTHRESGKFDEDLCNLWEEKIEYVFNTGTPMQAEFEWESADGLVVVDWRLTPEFAADGSVKSVLGVSRDITESKRSEKLLLVRMRLMEYSAHHSLEELLQKTLDEVGEITKSPIGFYHFVEEDQNTISLQSWSTGTTREFCTAQGKGLHYNIADAGVWTDCIQQRRPVVHNDYALLPHRKGMPKGHAPVIRELVVPIFREDRIVAILGVGNKPSEYTQNDIDVVTYLADIAWEITRRKRAETALNISEEKYRLVVENASEAIFIVQDGMIKFPNKRSVTLSGYEEGELMRIPFSDFIHKDDKNMVIEMHRKRLSGQEVPAAYSFRMINKSGEPVWVEISAVLISWDGMPAALTFLRDITMQKKLEEELLQARKMEAIGTLAGGVAHNFNNLLMTILGYTSMLLMKTEKTHPFYEKLKIIERQVESGSELTKQLLGFAQGGRYEVRPININELLVETSEIFGRTKKEIVIHKKLQDNLYSILADRGQIEQVFLNLYVNAWQAMPSGGELYLGTENVALDEEYRRQYGITPGAYIKITVTDTGVGIDADTQKRIFEPFFTTKDVGKGTGLGLASVYGIVKNQGGVINVYSEKGHGTAFTIYLPASEKEASSAKKTEEIVLGGNETILVVDDEPTNIEAMEELLKIIGYKIETANSGREAIERYKARGKGIDMVILDMVMAGIGGKETFKELKGIDADIRVLLSSGYSIDGEAEKLIEMGCRGFIQKPFRLDELSQKIRSVLDEK